VKLHRILAAGLLFLLTFAAAYASPNSVIAEVRDDGSLVIEGVHYNEPVRLRAALKKLRQRHVSIHIQTKPSMRFEIIGKAFLLLQKAGCADGCMKVGFITGPASSH
jgi:hypothetical protein